MKKPLMLLLFFSIPVLCIAGAGIIGWFGLTPEGAQRLLELVSRHTPVTIRADSVGGRILGDLQLGGLRVKLPQQEVVAEKLRLIWRPAELLSGRISIATLFVQKVRITDFSPVVKKEPGLAWPKPPRLPPWLEVWVDRLTIEDLRYRRQGAEESELKVLSSHLFWSDRTLSLRNLSLQVPAGGVTGELMAGFAPAALRSDLVVKPARPVGGMDRFFITTRSVSQRRPEQLAVNLAIRGAAGSHVRYEASGDAGVTRESVNLRKLRLVRPGRKGEITGDGTVRFAGDDPVVSLRMRSTGLDLSGETGVVTDLAGEVRIEGTIRSYRGNLAIANRGEGWRNAGISSSFSGGTESITLDNVKAALLRGNAVGKVKIGWKGGISVAGAIAARDLDPSAINPGWSGVVNADISASVDWLHSTHRGELQGTLLQSTLRGQALQGEANLKLVEKNLIVQALALKGNGFTVTAAGELADRLEFAATVSDLSGVLPGAAGGLAGTGWARWRNGLLSGSIAANGRGLAAKGASIAAASLDARLYEGAGYPLQVRAALQDAAYGEFGTDRADLAITGTLESHAIAAALKVDGSGREKGGANGREAGGNPGAAVAFKLAGGYRAGRWRGEILDFSGHDQVGPWSMENRVQLAGSADLFSMSTMNIAGAPGERLFLAGSFRTGAGTGVVNASWIDLDLSRANRWLQDVAMKGSSGGALKLEILPDRRLRTAADLRLKGEVAAQGERLTVRDCSLRIDGGAQGTRADFTLDLAEAGTVTGKFSSGLPARLAIPEQGRVSAEWSGFDVALLRSRLPAGVRLEGHMGGRLSGDLLPGGRFLLAGTNGLQAGRARVSRGEGEMTVSIKTMDFSWKWQGEELSGGMELALAEFGRMRGDVRLPLPAALPVRFDQEGEVRGALKGGTRELGIIAAFFPGLVQESRGELGLDLKVAGTWQQPQFSGSFSLFKGGAYLPSAGIRLENLQLDALFDQNMVKVTRFEVNSGPGYLSGQGEARLEGWRLAGYHGSIQGEMFQTAWLPEIRAISSPRLTFAGGPEKLTVRGVVRLPELHVYGPAGHAPVEPSSDVVFEGVEPKKIEPARPLGLDLEVAVLLGDRIFVKAKGIDALLGGGMTLTGRKMDEIASRGEIKVLKGRYKAYGLDLDIVRGRLFYAGTPLTQPALDILALRTVADVKAGVTVGGTLQVPVVKLYSEPAMPDVDILAYMVLGHPMGGESSEQAGLLSQAAGFLLSSGQSVVLQDQIKTRLGLSTLDIESQGKTPGYMGGYKPVQVAPPGKAPAQAQGAISETLLTVGKYLTPELYISYGRSLFSGANLFRLRYDISRHWQVESETGTESGADIYYKIEFD